ncbi:MAG: transglutaminase domain-containing protein [Planctomycetes bacterium]|nr:transglutaminase domain-containing protein [Planctomycetota bacterium]
MNPKRILPVLLLTLSLSSFVFAAEKEKLTRYELTEQDIENAMADDWYGMYLAGSKIGYMHHTCMRKDGNIFTSMSGRMQLTRMGKVIEVNILESKTFSGTAPYPLLAVELIQSDGVQSKKVNVSKKDKGFVTTIKEGENEREMVTKECEVFLSDEISNEVWIRKYKPGQGDRINVRDFDLEMFGPAVNTAEISSVSDTLVKGVSIKLYKIALSNDLRGSVGSVTVDDDANLVTATFGGLFEMRLEDEKSAKEIGHGADIFDLGNVKIQAPLGGPKQITSLVLEASGDAAGRLRSSPWQKVEKGEDGKVILSIGEKFGVAEPVSEKDIEENLSESATYPIKEKVVLDLAREAVGDAATPEEKVKRLVSFVDKYVEDSYNANPLSVIDLIRDKAGDCSEHALLFATLARASGIPCREASGLVYMGDAMMGFGWHAWCEVALDGKWYPVDPTWGEYKISAGHIRTGAGRKMGSTTMETIGRLKLKALSVNGKPVQELKPTTQEVVVEEEEEF